MPAAAPLSIDDILASEHVPSLPEVALRIIEIAQQPDPDTQELIRTVRTDPGIAGRILKFANSALFGLRHRPTSIEAAVPILGSTLVRTLTLGFSLARQTPQSDALRPWFRQLWRESMFQAAAAEFLAERVDGADPPTWFLAGLLQDVGRLAMLNVAQVDYFQNVLDQGRSQPLRQLEANHFGFTHTDVSSALCRKWNLPAEMVAAIGAHHNPVRDVTPESCSALKAGLAAAAGCSEYMEAVDERLEATRGDVERFLIEGYGCLPSEIPEVLAEMDNRSGELAAGFSVDVGNPPSRERILARAQLVLQQIAQEAQLRRVTGVSPEDTSVEAGPCADRSVWKDWLDQDLSTYNRRFLDKALPQQLDQSFTEGAAVGLLRVDFSAAVSGGAEDASGAGVDPATVIETIRRSVRPMDSVVSFGPSTAVLILPGLNYDVLSRLASRIQEEVNCRLGLPDGAQVGSTVGGVVVVPAGRKVATPAQVLSTLDQSADRARELSSSGIAFQLLMGRKARALDRGR
ncbi:MAG: HDOD domain-containing protein [Fuerstiella sp.]